MQFVLINYIHETIQLLETKQFMKTYERTVFINLLVYSSDFTLNLVLVEAKILCFS